MTVKAREVLDDCRVALSLLEEETDIQRWRIHWAAAVALIRLSATSSTKWTVGIKSSSRPPTPRSSRWKSADPKHEIFREFIERERNNLLKEYRSDVHPLAEVALAVEFTAQPVDGGPPVRFSHVGKIGENIYRPLLDGAWEGDDARDVLSEAIAWWERELAAIEQEAARRQSAEG